MESKLQDLLDNSYSGTREQIITIICQTLLYGIYLCLVPIVIHAMITNGLQSRARKWLLAIITSMLALMTVFWITSVVLTFQDVDVGSNAVTACYGRDNAYSCLFHEFQPKDTKGIPTSEWLGMFLNILLINYNIVDGVVVWRAWALCSDQSRVILMIPVVMLGINTIIYLMMAVGRAIVLSLIPKHEHEDLRIVAQLINITQLVYLAFSVLINIFATSIIGLKAWKYRKLLMESGIGIRTPRLAIRILAILVESGMIYILFGVTSVVSICIIFATGQTSPNLNVFMLAGLQLVGIYPIVVILLVEKTRSLDSTFSSFGTIIDTRGDRPSHASQVNPMAFASGSVLASGGKTDSVAKSPHTTIHVSRVTFDYMLEPGDAGMSAGNGKISNEKHTASYQ